MQVPDWMLPPEMLVRSIGSIVGFFCDLVEDLDALFGLLYNEVFLGGSFRFRSFKGNSL